MISPNGTMFASPPPPTTDADHVVVCAPTGADATNIQNVLREGGIVARTCKAEEMKDEVGRCAVLVLTEEALTRSLYDVLLACFAAQPVWSDLPIVLMGNGGISNSGAAAAAKLKGPHRTITLLERPLRAATLLVTIQTLISARRRQYEIRALLNERDALLSSLESRVEERTADLRRMVEEMEAFSYSVSHDLRSPLRSVEGYARVLQEDYGRELPEGAKVYVEKIARAAARMDSLTQDVLAYTRATQCKMEMGQVDLDSVFAEVIEQYPAIAAAADRIQISRPLGEVVGHVPSLIQCFSNLLGNALKFVPEGRVPAVRVYSEQCDPFVRVTVEDNGIGIDPSQHARIFGMFERAAKTQFAGTGIGLAIVKKAVERMGGAVGVLSKLDQGSRFWTELVAVQGKNGIERLGRSGDPGVVRAT